MVTDPEGAFRDALREASKEAIGVDPQRIPLTYPPKAELGDLASPLCFELAKQARKAPRAIAEALVASFVPAGGIARVEVAGPGYINAYLDRDLFLRKWLLDPPKPRQEAVGKDIVEHTNINPNKAAHIGHLRNAVLGDTLARCLRHVGRSVEVQNYIDDTGVQVADLVVGFRVLREEGLDLVRERYAEQRLRERAERFDYLAWDLYAEVTRFYQEDDARLSHRRETLHAMEQGDNPIAELAAHVARRMVSHHLTTMNRLGVRYDVLPRESDILALRFWDTAFERLKRAGSIRLVDQGKHKGCWVMNLKGAEEGSGEDEKVIVRSDATVTYVGKDVAYQLWKFGLLGLDFGYAGFDWSPLDPLYNVWSSAADGGAADAPAFGRGHTVYNVIDRRQSYLQRVVQQGLESLGHEAEAQRSIHYAYEMVALSPAAVQAIFPEMELSDEDRARPYIEMSGRRGLGIRADELLDTLFDRARAEVARRNEAMTPVELDTTAKQIMVGALRYYMLRYTRNRVVAFDLDAALAFEGETGPYLQYSVVRARNILAKVAERFAADDVDATVLADRASFAALAPESAAEHWNLVLQMLRVDAAVEQAIDALELSTVAKHAYVTAQAFNSFYHRYHVVKETDPAVRTARTAIIRLYHDGMIRLLDLMGVEVPARM